MSYFYNFQARKEFTVLNELMIYIAVISFYYLTCKWMYIIIALYFVFFISISKRLEDKISCVLPPFHSWFTVGLIKGKAVIQLESIFKYHHAYNP